MPSLAFQTSILTIRRGWQVRPQRVCLGRGQGWHPETTELPSKGLGVSQCWLRDRLGFHPSLLPPLLPP